jgi:hypothetical protein
MMEWKGGSVDAVTANDQIGKKYGQHIKDKFHRFMSTPSTRSLQSLQGLYDVTKQCCSYWSGCLDQVRNAPPIGCPIDE